MNLDQQLLYDPINFIDIYGTDPFYNILEYLDYNDIINICDNVSQVFKDICQTERFQILIRQKYEDMIRIEEQKQIQISKPKNEAKPSHVTKTECARCAIPYTVRTLQKYGGICAKCYNKQY